MECEHAAMRGYGRQGVTETEAVRKHDVVRLDPELLLVEFLGEEDVLEVGLGRRDIEIIGIPGCACRIPAALLDIFDEGTVGTVRKCCAFPNKLIANVLEILYL